MKKKKKKKEKEPVDLRKYLLQGLVRQGFRLVELGLIVGVGTLLGVKISF
jgi:hypothetical protein